MYTGHRLLSLLLAVDIPLFFCFFCVSGDICSTALPASKANIQKKSKHRVQIPQHESHTSAPAIQQWTQAAALVTGEFALISQLIIPMLKIWKIFWNVLFLNHSLLQMWCGMKLETLTDFFALWTAQEFLGLRSRPSRTLKLWLS